MASPVDSLKNNLFGQLKSYSSAVHDAFEQRIARPLLALKRDISRPTSETRASTDPDVTTSTYPCQTSSPFEISDGDVSSSFKNIFNKVRHSLSPTPTRRTFENQASDRTKVPSKETRNLSLCVTTSYQPRQIHLRNKSVSFAENIETDTDYDNDIEHEHHYSVVDQNRIVQNAYVLADKILKASIEAAAKADITNYSPMKNDNDFEQDFYQAIKPRRLSINNVEDLVYQDLSAEIVSYILKHALRTLKKEQDELLISTSNPTFDNENEQNKSSIPTEQETTVNHSEQDEDFIDLK